MQAVSGHLSSFEKLQDYERRSLIPADDSSAEQERASNCACVVFRLSDFKLAVTIESVSEILDLPVFSPVPGSKPWVLGLSNVRGNLVTVCDLYWYLTNVRTPLTTRSRLIVADLQGKPMGLLVDEVYGQRHFHTDTICRDDVVFEELGPSLLSLLSLCGCHRAEWPTVRDCVG